MALAEVRPALLKAYLLCDESPKPAADLSTDGRIVVLAGE